MRHLCALFAVLLGFPAVSTATITTFSDTALFVTAAGTTLTTIDFETYPNGTPIPSTPNEVEPTVVLTGSEFSSKGITLSSPIGRTLGVNNGGFFGLTNQLSPSFNPPTNVGPIRVDFSIPVGAMGADFFDIDVSGPTTLEVFDLGSSSLGIFAGPFTDPIGFLGLVSTVPISYAVFELGVATGTVTNDGVTLDNLIFTEIAAAPEPNTWLLLAGVGIALAWRHRRGIRTDCVLETPGA